MIESFLVAYILGTERNRSFYLRIVQTVAPLHCTTMGLRLNELIIFELSLLSHLKIYFKLATPTLQALFKIVLTQGDIGLEYL
jgi:hypothetical protein